MTLYLSCSAESEIEGWVREGGGCREKRIRERRKARDGTERKLAHIFILTDSVDSVASVASDLFV